MKKIYSFMVAAVALFAAVSCNKELPQEENLPTVGETVVYTASTDAADTKAVLDGTVSKWCGEELITLHDGTNAFTFYANAGETPVSKVDFTYTPGEGQPAFNATEVMAVYPSGDYSANVSDKTVSNVFVPNNQTLADNTYPATAAVAVAYSTTTELSFKNATTLLKFKVAGDDVTYGCFAVDGKVSGKFDVDYNEGEPLMNPTEDATHYVDFHMNDAFLSKAVTYYIAIAPATVNNFRMYLNGKEIKAYENSYTFKRNVILDLGTLTYEAPERASTIYLKPRIWNNDGSPHYYAYFYNSTGNKPVLMSDNDSDGIYEADVPEGDYSKVIFCRFNPESASFNWESVWNQTSNLNVPEATDDKLCYVINGWGEGDGAKSVGEWETLEDASVVWTIAGGFNSWTATPMEKADEYFVTKNVTKLNEGFKILEDGNWLGYGAVEVGKWIVLGGDDNITVADAAPETAYDVYLNPETKKFIIVDAGADVPSIAPKTYGICGDLTSWGETEDIPMALVDGKYVAYNVTFASAGGFKIRANKVWEDSDNWGLSATGAVEVGKYYDVITSGGSGNLTIIPGTYDIWFDLDNARVYIMKPGTSITTATKGTPIAPSSDVWYLAGGFNSWALGDEKYKFVNEAGWFVLKNCTFLADYSVKINGGTWDYNRQGVWNGMNGSFSIEPGSGNIDDVRAGTYDIYMNSNASKIYFLAPGVTPSSTTYKLYIKVKTYELYLWAWGGYTTDGSWPGLKLSQKENLANYGECYVVEIPVGEGLCNFIVSGGGGQTPDLNSSHVIVLSNGDLFYEWE